MNYENKVLLTGTLAPIDAQKELYIMEVAKESLDIEAFASEKRNHAMTVFTEAQFKLGQFVLAAHKVDQIVHDIKVAATLKDLFPSRAEEEVRLTAVLESLNHQAHLVPVVEAVLTEVHGDPDLTDEEKLFMEMEAYAHVHDTLDGFQPSPWLEEEYAALLARREKIVTCPRCNENEMKFKDSVCAKCEKELNAELEAEHNSGLDTDGDGLPF